MDKNTNKHAGNIAKLSKDDIVKLDHKMLLFTALKSCDQNINSYTSNILKGIEQYNSRYFKAYVFQALAKYSSRMRGECFKAIINFITDEEKQEAWRILEQAHIHNFNNHHDNIESLNYVEEIKQSIFGK